jgi:hypothetical protein
MAREGSQAGSKGGDGVAAKGMYECSARRQGAARRMACSKLVLQQKKRGGVGRSPGFITHQRGRGSHHREQKAASKDARFGAHFTQMYTFSEGFNGG